MEFIGLSADLRDLTSTQRIQHHQSSDRQLSGRHSRNIHILNAHLANSRFSKLPHLQFAL